MKMVFLHDLNAEAFALLKQYQKVCAAGELNFQNDIEFQRQPFWLRWQHWQAYRDLRSEGLRLLERKTYLEKKLAVVPLRTNPPSSTESISMDGERSYKRWLLKFDRLFNRFYLNHFASTQPPFFMNPVTLFTGHVIPSLGTIAAIGPIQRQVDGEKHPHDHSIHRRLTLTIYLREGARLEYTAIEQHLLRDSSDELLRWHMAMEKLEEEKRRLIEAWSQVLEDGSAPGRSTPQDYTVGDE